MGVRWNYRERHLSPRWDGSLLAQRPGLLVVVLLPGGECLRENGADAEQSRVKRWRSREIPDNTIGAPGLHLAGSSRSGKEARQKGQAQGIPSVNGTCVWAEVDYVVNSL